MPQDQEPWDAVRPRFLSAFFRIGATRMSEECHCSRPTVYRHVHGKRSPSQSIAWAIRCAVDRMERGERENVTSVTPGGGERERRRR